MQTSATDLAILKPEIYGPQSQTLLAIYVNFLMNGMADRVDLPAGELVPFPGFKELSGAPDIMGDDYNPDIGKIDPLKDIAVVRHLAKAFGADDLARIITGQDPDGEIARQIANYFARYAIQNSFFSVLKGVFATGGPLNLTNLHDAYVDHGTVGRVYFTPAVASAGLAKVGDRMSRIAAWVMHSAIVADLTAAGLVSTLVNQTPYGYDGNGIVNMFMGKPIVMTDECTTVAGTSATKFRTFGIARGALALGIQKDLNPEQDRNTLKKLNYISTDIHFAAHVRGCKYVGATGNKKPTDAELETGTNWALSAELAKNVGVVAIDTNAGVA